MVSGSMKVGKVATQLNLQISRNKIVLSLKKDIYCDCT